jgi:hypothetical protein
MKFVSAFILLSISVIISNSSVLAQDDCSVTGNCSESVAVAEVSAEDIAAYPTPNVKQIYPDDQLLYDRVYRVVEGAVDIYDAPGGNVTSTLGDGFNYVTLLQTQGDWAEISQGHWVKTENLSENVLISRFAGVTFPDEPLPYPMAWILRNVKPSVKPGEDPPEDVLPLIRYTKVNLYATVTVDGHDWYQVGVDQWVHQFNVAKILPVERFEDIDTEHWISVDLYEQVAIAYEGTKPVWATLVASGLPDWETDEGLFHIYLRYPRTVMSGATGQPDFYYLEEVPWTMYFNEDTALHGTYWHDGFGYRHSHGCVNLSITDAYWLYNWASPEFDFTVDNDLGPAVYVYSSGQYK